MCTQINPSPIEIKGFDQIVAMAKSMKNCSYFFADSKSKVLYGIYNEQIIRWLPMPLTVLLPVDISFISLSSPNIDFINEHKNFGLASPGIIYPLDAPNNAPLLDLRPQTRSEYLAMQRAMESLYNFHATAKTLNMFTPSIFGDMENHPVVQEVVNNKITEGSRYLQLTGMNGKKYGFMIWRSLFSLNKGDKLTIKIYDKIDDGRLFQVVFLVDKKKSPISNVLAQYTETTHAMYINI